MNSDQNMTRTYLAENPRPCVGCGGTKATPLYRDLVTCSACGMVYYPRQLAPGEAEAIYDHDYFAGAEYFDYLGDESAHNTNFRRRLRYLERWIPAGQRLFEIGCAYGLFLKLASSKYTVAGCDIAGNAVTYARQSLGLDARVGDFLDVGPAPGDCDAVCLWDTIEHLDDPGRYLDHAASVLPANGILALTTGDMGSWLARRQGPKWRQIHPPSHLWYFSRATMTTTLNRFGFDVIDFRSIGISRSIGQIVHGLTCLGQREPSTAFRWTQASGLGKWTVYLNTFDLMFVVARRRPRQALRQAA